MEIVKDDSKNGNETGEHESSSRKQPCAQLERLEEVGKAATTRASFPDGPDGRAHVAGLPRGQNDPDMIFVGVFFTPMIILTPTYIDDGASKLKAPLYMGIYFTTVFLGLVIGFLLSSLFIGLYVDFDRVNMSSIDIDPSDTRWVGAWWLGYLVNGALMGVIGIPVMLLPKRFSPSREEDAVVTTASVSSSYSHDNTNVEREAIRRIKEFPSALRRLLSNVPLMSISIGCAFERAVVSGLLMFFTKYIENQFRVSAAKASFLTGLSY
ncbi:solute carrier organic anion transporter family member 1B2-like [Ptychodera flava]|uniref:solute carrier organic anion transporter family member 1B2-like n=1 Tax=Ptychodera flava TaxID=63121 RepID=UPI00396A9295